MYLFFDTETTGFPKNWNAPHTDTDNWPNLVQIAWMIFNEEGVLKAEADYIIKPNGYRIPKASTRIHGVSTEQAMAEGVEARVALQHFVNDVTRVETIVAHNLSFDENVVGAALVRTGIRHTMFDKERICTMKSTVEYCKIVGRYGYKWPKLIELHQLLFGEGFDDEHDAAADIRATAKCFWELKKRGIL